MGLICYNDNRNTNNNNNNDEPVVTNIKHRTYIQGAPRRYTSCDTLLNNENNYTMLFILITGITTTNIYILINLLYFGKNILVYFYFQHISR